MWAAFPAASYCVRIALKQLWFSSALLLSLLGCLSTFWVLLHSGLKHYLSLSPSSGTTSSCQREPALKLFPKWTGGWSRSWEMEQKPSCRQDPLRVGAHRQVKTGVEVIFYLLVKSAGVWHSDTIIRVPKWTEVLRFTCGFGSLDQDLQEISWSRELEMSKNRHKHLFSTLVEDEQENHSCCAENHNP